MAFATALLLPDQLIKTFKTYPNACSDNSRKAINRAA